MPLALRLSEGLDEAAEQVPRLSRKVLVYALDCEA